MATLRFNLNFKSTELNSLDLPIEIRRPDSSLVERVLSSQPVELKPGRYYVTARLPGGQRLAQAFTIGDAPLTLTLAPDPEDESPHEWEEVSHYLDAPSKRSRPLERPWDVTADAGPPTTSKVRAQVRFFTGNPILGTVEAIAPERRLKLQDFVQGRAAHFSVFGGGPLVLAQLVEPGGIVQNMMVPAGGISDATLVFTRRADATCSMEPHLKHNVADLMLRFAGAGEMAEADEVVQSAMLDAQQLIASKVADPIAAAVAGYSMLRFARVRELSAWTFNLYSWFHWLPDGVAIHGEHLARLGKHREAEAVFSELPGRGLPVVADGFFYVVERLKLYSKLDASKAQGVDVARAGSVLKQLEPFAAYIHRKRPILGYFGLDPAKPSLDPAPAAFTDPHAIDLATWLDDSVLQAAHTVMATPLMR